MKKLLSLLISLVLVSLMFVPVFAATTINANEQRVLDRYVAGVALSAGKEVPTTAQVNVAKNFFMMDGVDFTAADADAVIASMDKVSAITKSVAKLDDLTSAQMTSILNAANDGAVAVSGLGLYVTYDSASKSFYLNGNNGLSVSQSSNGVIKQTGFDFGTTYAVICGMVVALGATVILTKKYNLLASKA